MRKRYQISLIVITVALLGAICLATSYALWTVNKTQTGENIVESGCFDITLSDESGLINLENAYPITDEASASLTPYAFKINNTCTIASKYIVNLEVLPTSDLDVQYVSSSIDNGEVVRLKNANSADPTIEGVTVSKTIGSGVVGAGKSKTLSIRLWVDEGVTLDDTDAINKILNAKIVIIGSGAPEPPTPPKCIRATTLHTETCSQTITFGYCSDTGSIGNGNTITYGNTTTTPGVLNTGDAFDCDVDGSGYNHRFYYVSDLYTGGEEGSETWDEDTAVLIYYSNVIINGTTITPNNTTGVAYNSTGINYEGPLTAIAHIPSKDLWTNLSINESRQIRNDTGTTSVTYSGTTYPITFTGYTNKAARFLTYQEIKQGCGGFNIDSSTCRFLLENTVYSNKGNIQYWLETPSSNFSTIYYVESVNRNINANAPDWNSYVGVRPAIEVA